MVRELCDAWRRLVEFDDSVLVCLRIGDHEAGAGWSVVLCGRRVLRGEWGGLS